MKVSLVIAAAGASKRFIKEKKQKKRLGKLSFHVGQKPILTHAVESFRDIPQIREIILAIRPGTEKWIRASILNGHLTVPVRLVRGGRTRAESVWNALRRTSPKNDWVLVHDGARPFPPRKAILDLFRKCSGAEGAILARPVVPTLKRVSIRNGQVLETIDRSQLFEAETPQLIRRSFLLKAYRENPKAFSATDESSLIEFLGGKVKVVPHSGWNEKVTTAEDLHLAEAYHDYRQGNAQGRMRIGFGRDTHRLVEGRKLYLGGVHIPSPKGSLGHSDGDALLHAVMDALLGALGAGDIGEWFSDRNPQYKNIPSRKMLEKVLEEARRRHWRPSRVDSVITLEKPRLGPFKKKIRRKVAGLLDLEEEAVSVKAKTMEGLGPEGEGRAVTCEALVLMCRGGVTPPSGRGDRAPTVRNSI